MDKTPPPNNKSPDRRSPTAPSNLLWYLLLVVVGTMFLVSLFQSSNQYELPYGQLVELIEKGAPGSAHNKNDDAAIELTEGSETHAVRVRYHSLSDITIGSHEITGKVVRQVIDAPTETPPAKIEFHTNRKGLEFDSNDLFKCLHTNGFLDVRAESPNRGWRDYVPLLLLTGLSLAALWFIARRIGGTGSAIAFGRSRGRLFAQEDIGVTFNDVAGIDEAVDEVREVVEFLKTPEKYRTLGGRIPKGVLLVGPPGTGKTLLAKAIAGEAGVPFFSLSGSDFVEMFVGVGAARVRDLFQQAQAKAPCIVFIDELDALGKTRGTSLVGGHDEREQTLNALLVEMDGFSSNSGVIVMAATNRPETLDPALLRPGRFDRNVLVDRPDVRGREAILRVHVQKIKLNPTVDLREIAGITSGFVGADLANLVNEAALLAARKNKNAVCKEELNEAIERVTVGLEKKQRIISKDEKERVAYHESAHALVAYSLPNTDPVHKVSIIPTGLAALGYTLHRPEGDRYLTTQSELESRIQVLLAGTVAEEVIFADVSTGAQNDLERATELARSMVMDFGMSRLGRVTFRDSAYGRFLGPQGELARESGHSDHTARKIDQEMKHIIDQGLEKVRHILETRRTALVALAQRLLEKETVNADELRETIEASSSSPTIVPGTDSMAKRPALPPQEPPQAEANSGG